MDKKVFSELSNTTSVLHKEAGRRNWILVLEDQLSDEIGPLRREDLYKLGIVLIESY